MSPEAAQSFLALAIGFAAAGMIATGYQLLLDRPLGFHLMMERARSVALTAVPLLVFAAPFVIFRNMLRGARLERRQAGFVMLGTIIAGLWSLMSGTVLASGWLNLLRFLA